MKIKNANLEYWVFYIDFNTKKAKRINILKDIEKDIAKHIKSSENSYKHIQDRNTLKNYLRSEFMYHYWSKTEMEYIVNRFIEDDFENAQKLDVWYQIEPNLDLITDYIIKEMEIKFY